VARARSVLTEQQTLMQRMIEERHQNAVIFAKNLEIGAHNVEVHRSNADLARARHDDALLKVSLAGGADAQRSLAHTRELLGAAQASEARLVTALADLDRQIAALSTR